MYYYGQNGRNVRITGGTITGVTISNAPFAAVTDPAGTPTFAAVTTAIIDAYNGVVITLTGAGNAQTLQSPTVTTAGKIFTVINNDTSAANTIAVNGITITAGESQSFIWDGSAWGPTDLGITEIPVTVAQGGTGRATGTTAYSLVATGTTATGAQQTLANGATTEILVGGGASALPVWTTAQGSGAPVRATSPALTTPNIGTPSAGTLTSCTGLPLAGLVPGTAESDFIVAGASPFTWAIKTLADTKTLLHAAPGNFGGTTAGTIRSLIDEDLEPAADTLTANQLSGGQINNIGQGAVDVNLTLPAAVEGYNFIAQVGEPSANYWRFTAATAGTMIVDGVINKNYAQFSTPGIGNHFVARTAKVAPQPAGILTGAALAIGGTKSSVATGAFTYYIAGTKYAKDAVAAGTAMNAVTTAQNKYGCQALDIGTDGTIHAISCTNIAAGLDSAVLAYEDLPAAAASHLRIGYVTAMSSDAGGFVWNTTLFDDAAVTEAYTSTAAYTPTYNWIVTTGSGTVTTN